MQRWSQTIQKVLGHTLAIAIVLAVTVSTAWAQGNNTTVPNTTPVTPPPITPSSNQVTTGATCAQQLDEHLITLARVSLGVTSAQSTADLAGLTAEIAAEAGQPFSNGAASTAVGAQATALGIGILDLVNQGIQIDLAETQNSLPSCDQVFTGTITVTNGGADITGDSIFRNNLGVVRDVNVGNNVTASRVSTTQGISTNGGGIVIGDRNLETFSSGITLGGGALSGAGFGGLQAFTSDVTSIAIGNAARADQVNSLALGEGAAARNMNATAIGAFAAADAPSATALGYRAAARDTNATAVGAMAVAGPSNSAAFGYRAVAKRQNQQVFGTQTNTYTMPGITSEASKNVQSGPLELATTDSAGNLATDGGAVFNAIARVQAGVAIATAMETPELASDENFGFRIGWGGFDSFDSEANALGMAAIGVIGRNLFDGDNRLALDVGVGLGWSEFKEYRENEVVAGRAGVQFTW